jgi:DNA polymerase-3 subunit gamma/tau
MLSLYRRHRPRTFDDVMGQEHIVRTLRNAVELDKVHHAYLFVGSRGTGKTSMAKLLACALNAEGGRAADRLRAGRRGVPGYRRWHVARCRRDGRSLQQLRRGRPRAT